MINISTYTTYPHRGNNKLYVLQLKAAAENRYSSETLGCSRSRSTLSNSRYTCAHASFVHVLSL